MLWTSGLISNFDVVDPPRIAADDLAPFLVREAGQNVIQHFVRFREGAARVREIRPPHKPIHPNLFPEPGYERVLDQSAEYVLVQVLPSGLLQLTQSGKLF